LAAARSCAPSASTLIADFVLWRGNLDQKRIASSELLLKV
jgi:hypothetical protein